MNMYAPMLATPFKGRDIRPYLEGNYRAQQKFDGDRLLGVWRPGARVQWLNRNGSPRSKRLPNPLDNLACPYGNGTSTVLLDGELVGNHFHVFDLLEVRFGEEHDLMPYAERRERLVEALPEGMFDQPRIGLSVVPEAEEPVDKALFLEQALERKCEGIILKDAGSTYRFGKRAHTWLKVKFEHTADVIIRSTRINDKESAEMVMNDPDSVNHRVRFVGDVSILGKGVITPGMVVEVKYLYVGSNGHLYQPRILRVRDDKTPVECTVDQLHYTDKGALVR